MKKSCANGKLGTCCLYINIKVDEVTAISTNPKFPSLRKLTFELSKTVIAG